MRPRGVGSAANANQKSVLLDAFEQLEQVVKQRERSGEPYGQVRAAEQMIQRWLVVFAREHLADICAKLLQAAADAAMREMRPPTQLQLPKKGDQPEPTAEPRDESTVFFLMETLRKVLSAAADGSGGALHQVSRHTPLPDGLLAFCFERVDLVNPTAVRHVGAHCVGLLSRSMLKACVDMFLHKMEKMSWTRSDEQRAYVAYARAAGGLALSVHSAEQAASSTRYLAALAQAIDKFEAQP